MLEYSIVAHDNAETLIVMVDGKMRTVSSGHANYGRIKDYLVEGGSLESAVRSLLDARAYVSSSLRPLSDRVGFDGRQITFDGDVIDNALSNHILRLLREGAPTLRSAVWFMEHLAGNPSPLSRRLLWKWLENRNFSLDPEGHIIGYKAVSNTADNLSITSGRNRVYVNGQVHIGRVPNPLGADVSIGRSEVNPDREHGCAPGLHVGTWNYAAEFGGPTAKILTVTVNPRDVVAVPRDCFYQKMRVCRYVVREVGREAQHETALVAFDSGDDPYDDEDDDEYFCG